MTRKQWSRAISMSVASGFTFFATIVVLEELLIATQKFTQQRTKESKVLNRLEEIRKGV